MKKLLLLILKIWKSSKALIIFSLLVGFLGVISIWVYFHFEVKKDLIWSGWTGFQTKSYGTLLV
jgi:hypothetical protein